MKKKIRKIRPDLILIGALLLVGAVIGLWILINRKAGGTVQVRVGGETQAEYPLSEDREVVITGADGGTNTLVIQGGEARISDASCPDKLCVHMGKIRYQGQSVICLPNQVTVEVVSGETDEDLPDAIAGGLR